MLMSADERLGRARVVLERRALAPAELLEPAIAESWARCLAAGLDPQRPPPARVVDDATLRAARAAHEVTRRLALAEMNNLYQQIAGTNFMIAFAAPDGLLLDCIADASFRDGVRTIRPGSLWSEAQCGTNALGTVATVARAVTVHGGEHFFASFGQLTCMAAPVFAPDGTLAGVIDASSDARSRQQHTSALVAMAATQIENGMFREQHRASLVIAFHSRGEYLHTLSAGLLALAEDGTVRGANAQARFLLQGLPIRPGGRFDAVFRTRLDSLVDAGRRGARVKLEDQIGSVFIANVENLRAAPMIAGAAPARPRFVAEDAAVAAALRQIEAAAARRLPILLRGETGTGKEQLARHAHLAAGRRGGFVAVNCAALPDSLIEAELFGHADGAFTGARRGGSPGLIAEADGGTLFLDEIGDMKRPLQAVLLRLLDDWTIRPVGGGKRRQVDVLLVAATNADLEAAIAEQRFRPDLYYRLNTVEIAVPPLRARTDFAAIARHLLAVVSPGATLSPGALTALAGCAWPGNIRELRSVLTRLVLAGAGGPIEADAVARLLAPARPAEATASLREATRARIAATHRETDGNLSETARRLGVSRNTIYRAIRPR